jgi:hypothetical protein
MFAPAHVREVGLVKRSSRKVTLPHGVGGTAQRHSSLQYSGRIVSTGQPVGIAVGSHCSFG